MMNNKRFVKIFLMLFLTLVLLSAMPVMIVDPFFHYHAPIDGLTYRLDGNIERYLNDGILRHFDYDAVIMGTSMSQNFKPSEINELFGLNCIKTAMSAGSSKEIGDQLRRAVGYNKDLKTVFMNFDLRFLTDDKDAYNYDDIPFYLYDNNLFNDTDYLFNSDVINLQVKKVLRETFVEKIPSDFDFDNYSAWMKYFVGKTGKDYILANEYERLEDVEESKPFGREDKKKIEEMLKQNYLGTIEENPDITFYIFFPPYSVLYFDDLIRSGYFDYIFDGLGYACSLFLEYDNVKLFSFYDKYDLTTDLEMYKDDQHYIQSVNSDIVKYMKSGEYMLTRENFAERLKKTREFYKTYDYDSIFE